MAHWFMFQWIQFQNGEKPFKFAWEHAYEITTTQVVIFFISLLASFSNNIGLRSIGLISIVLITVSFIEWLHKYCRYAESAKLPHNHFIQRIFAWPLLFLYIIFNDENRVVVVDEHRLAVFIPIILTMTGFISVTSIAPTVSIIGSFVTLLVLIVTMWTVQQVALQSIVRKRFRLHRESKRRIEKMHRFFLSEFGPIYKDKRMKTNSKQKDFMVH